MSEKPEIGIQRRRIYSFRDFRGAQAYGRGCFWSCSRPRRNLGLSWCAFSGHAYFSLKDDKARIDAVIWRGSMSRLRFQPGRRHGGHRHRKAHDLPGSSKYQIVIEQMEPAGAGALMALLEERKRKLGAEGLFDPERKRDCPTCRASSA